MVFNDKGNRGQLTDKFDFCDYDSFGEVVASLFAISRIMAGWLFVSDVLRKSPDAKPLNCRREGQKKKRQ
jgi:hypothetical protein